MDSVVKNFFVALSSRMNNENGLSDITYSMLVSSKKFSLFFLKYLFPDDSFIGDGIWVREFADVEGSRPDFKYEENNNSFIIENKIFDQHTHNEQYATDFASSRRAFIANYKPEVSEVNLYSKGSVKTWKDFCKNMQTKFLPTVTNEENILATGYLDYVKQIVSYWEVNKMNFNSIESIKSFFLCINTITENHGLKVKNGSALDLSTIDWIGKSYFDSNDSKYYFCLPLNSKIPGIELCVKPSSTQDEYALKVLADKINKNNIPLVNWHKLIDSYYGLLFDMKEDIVKKYFISSEVSLEDQEDCLNNFYEQIASEVNRALLN